MSYSDIVGSISGLLQFVVACYALRVSRAFGIARVGWLFFGAFSVLALVHVLLSVHPFGINIELGPNVNFLYEIISVFLLGNIAQVETLLWQRRKQEKAVLRMESEAELKIKAEAAESIKAKEMELAKARVEAHQAITKLQAELELLKQAQSQTQEQVESASQEELKAAQEQLTVARQAEAELQATAALLQAEVVQLKEAQTQIQEQTENTFQDQLKAYQDQLAVLRQSEETLQATVTALQAEIAQLKQAGVQVEKTLQDQLAAAHQSEAALRTTVTGFQVEALEPKQPPQPAEPKQPVEYNNNNHDLLAILRQSGIAEVAAMAQSRVAYIARSVKLMREHSKDLGKFMTRNPKGKQLPQSLSLLVDYLADEQFLLLKRIDSVKKKFAQISQPVVNGHSPDSVSGPTEELNGGPATPAENPATENGGAADFREHLIANVTETGTESPSADQELTVVEEPSITLLDPSEAPNRR